MIPKPGPKVKAGPRRIARKAGVKKRRTTKRAALVRQCDKLWGEIVRAKGACVMKVHYPQHECKGPLQAMHGLSRRYHGTRWLVEQGFPGCAAAHMRWTKEPMLWTRFLIERWGLIGYDAMWAQAQAGKPKDMNAVKAALEARRGAQ